MIAITVEKYNYIFKLEKSIQVKLCYDDDCWVSDALCIFPQVAALYGSPEFHLSVRKNALLDTST